MVDFPLSCLFRGGILLVFVSLLENDSLHLPFCLNLGNSCLNLDFLKMVTCYGFYDGKSM